MVGLTIGRVVSTLACRDISVIHAHHLAQLQCPHCYGALTRLHGDAQSGTVACAHQHLFTVRHGVLDLRTLPPAQSRAAQSNEWRLTAWAYERLWRPYALTILSGQRLGYERELPLICTGIATARVIVDVACSNGLYARAAARSAPQAVVIGIDRALPMLIEAERRAQAAHLDIGYVCADARDLPMPDAECDAVFIGGSWNEMEEIPRVIAQMSRISRPGAQLRSMGLTASPRWLARHLQAFLSAQGGVHFPAPHQLADMLSTDGWQIDRQHHYGIVEFVWGSYHPQ